MSKFIHVSVAWPYANGDLHVGHLAGAYLPADIFARYHRLKGNRVLMVSGSDSHGTPISVEADKRGVTPRQLFEQYHRRFLETQQHIGISYDLFTHTDTENHYRVSQDIFLRLQEANLLFKGRQSLLYSEAEGRFLPDRYVEGTCPHCDYPQARGDQCDNCGRLLDVLELINPRSKGDGSTPVIRETEHFFLDLPAFSDQLAAYIETHADHWRPNVTNFVRNYIKGGLKARPVTRDIDWGIPVPLEGYSDKRLYVWFEAVIGYLSASIEWAKNNGDPEAWKDWWYNPQCEMYCFIGKDNIPFHAVIWPAQLLGVQRLYEDDATRTLILPYDVPANEFLNIEGAKSSKSRNWAIWLPDLLSRYDPDAVRYYLTSAMPETRDSDFSWLDFVRRNNDELVAAWGNLANRVLSFAYKHWDGVVPTPGELRPIDHEIIGSTEAGFTLVGGLIEEVKLRGALAECMALTRAVNGYLDRAPWYGVIKEDKQEAATTVYTALRCIDALKIILAPFLPFSSEQLHHYLGYDGQLFGNLEIVEFGESERSHQALITDHQSAGGKWAPGNLLPGQALRAPKPLYKKLEDEVIEEERGRMGG